MTTARRAVAACEDCRRTKSKCDMEVPCGRCSMKRISCEYQRLSQNWSSQFEKRINECFDEQLNHIRKLLESYETERGKETKDTRREPCSSCRCLDPRNHITGTVGLLLVKEIAIICRGDLGIEDEKYPIAQEYRREMLLADQSEKSFTRQMGGTEGCLDFSNENIHNLVKVYWDHMGILHPIISPPEIDLLVECFINDFAGVDVGNAEDYQQFLTTSSRPIDSVLVLLFIALGKICNHKGKLPDRYSPSNDVGMEYFALATRIISNLAVGMTLEHINANILACLFCGQLGRITEGHRYLSSACYGVQVLLQRKLEYLKMKYVEDQVIAAEENPFIITYWTCFQLESDIIAELPLPPTGLLAYGMTMPALNIAAAANAGLASNIIESYVAQFNLRRYMNQLQSSNNVLDSTLPYEEFPIRDYAPHMQWNILTGELAQDILSARLRASFYWTAVLAYRPFVLEFLKQSKNLEDYNIDFQENTYRGLLALIQNTAAFHGLDSFGTERLTVTNIWETAHAQWGNVMILQAAYLDLRLSASLLQIIPENHLQDLFKKTLRFLELHAAPYSTLYRDWKILKLSGQESGLLGVV